MTDRKLRGVPPLIYHLAEAAHWDRALVVGSYEQSSRGLTLEQVGFIHASSWDQLEPVAQRFYAPAPDRLVVLEIDVEELAASGSLVRYERAHPADPGSPLYPHIYGPLPTSCVCRVLSAGFEDGGAFVVRDK